MKKKITGIKFDSLGSTLTYTNNTDHVLIKMPESKPIEYHCYTCGILVEGTVYTDADGLGLSHGAGVQCKKCYLEDGHWQCSCNIEWFMLDIMKFCHQCGKERE